MDEIENWCKTKGITEYDINDQGEIDVYGDVDLSFHTKDIKYKFGKVTGNFTCIYTDLKSLINSPRRVEGDYDISNNKLTSLEFCPEYVGGKFKAEKNQISSLKFLPDYLGGEINLNNNLLTTLQGLPERVNGALKVGNNKIGSIDFLPKIVTGTLLIHRNPISSLYGMPAYPYHLLSLMHTEVPDAIRDLTKVLDYGKVEIFCKFQAYYEVWTPEFNEDNFNILIEDIKDGLE